MQAVFMHITTTTTTVLRPFFRDYLGEPVPEENFWTLWCKVRLTETDTQTIHLGATPSGLTSTDLHHPPIFYRPAALPAAQKIVSKHWTQICHNSYLELGTQVQNQVNSRQTVGLDAAIMSKHWVFICTLLKHWEILTHHTCAYVCVPKAAATNLSANTPCRTCPWYLCVAGPRLQSHSC